MAKINDDSSIFLKKLGERIAALRTERQMTQVQLGYATDMEKASVHRIENGGTNPTIMTLRKISVALDVSLSDLLSDL